MKTQNVYQTLNKCLDELSGSDLALNVRDGTLSADLHAYYNEVGKKEGWLKPEYATPLSQQDETNKIKNVDAAKDVVQYWLSQFDQLTDEGFLMDAIIRSVSYEANRGDPNLEAAADSQHEQWKRFIGTYQKERVTPGNPKFREANYNQYNAAYSGLNEKEKDQDRLIVAVVTDRVLERSDIGYERQINV